MNEFQQQRIRGCVSARSGKVEITFQSIAMAQVRNVLWFQFEWVRVSEDISEDCAADTREAMFCRDGVSARSPSEKCWVEGCQVIVRLVLCRERQKHV